jgi:protein-disulfide isomerase
VAESNKNQNVVTIDIQPFLTPISVLLAAVILTTGLLVGFNNLADSMSGGGIVAGSNNDGAGTQETPPPAGDPTTGQSTIDDDAGLGNLNAKVAFVEFSDYNCSFCARYHTDGTMDRIIENFVDTGDMYYVYRDFPGVGGETTAKVAAAAECIRRDLGGNDSDFFSFVKKKYTNQQANDFETLATYVEDLGISASDFIACAEKQEHVDEVYADLEDASALGMSGTPSFLVGVMDSDGNVDGEVIVGAQPYEVFEAAINRQLDR